MPRKPTDTAQLPFQALGAPPPDLQPAPQPVPAGPPPRGSVLGWVLKGLGLVLVAAVSGLVWWAIQAQPSGAPGKTKSPTSSNKAANEFDYAQVGDHAVDSDCAEHSTLQVKNFFKEHPCKRVYRALFDVTLGPDSKKVLVSVIAVRMPDDGSAAAFKEVVDGDGTGSVLDLAKEGRISVPGGPEWVSNGEYESTIDKDLVVIAESDFYGAAKDSTRDTALLDRISHDALRLGPQMVQE